MDVRLAAAAVAATVALATPTSFLQSRQLPSGGYAEARRTADPELTAWVVLGLTAAGAQPGAKTREYLVAQESRLESAADFELAVAAESALGGASPKLVARLHDLERPNGAIGPGVNTTAWGVIALRQAGEPVPAKTARYLLARQARGGGWGWAERGGADSNDTAAVVEALAALGVRGRSIERGLAYLRRLQNRDGGFELVAGRGSDVQSTAWAIQAFLAAGREPGARAFRYLARRRRSDGSYRYSARYAATPVWVTAQVLPAIARKPFPLQ
jgi:Squalene-hopene cyclase C-terminal domain